MEKGAHDERGLPGAASNSSCEREKRFDLKLITTPEEDLAAILG